MYEEHYKDAEVARYVYQNLAYNLDFTRFKLIATGSARASFQDQTVNTFTNEGNRLRAQLMATYPIFDAKESNERLEKMIIVKQKIIVITKNYFKLKAEHRDKEISKLMLLRLETRYKSRKLQGVGSFDEWFKIVDDLRKINKEISISELEISENRQILLSYVLKNKRAMLKEML